MLFACSLVVVLQLVEAFCSEVGQPFVFLFLNLWTELKYNGFDFKHSIRDYRFHLDFIDEKSGIRIIDNVHELMDVQDPLGWNFRPGAPFVTVPQYEVWYPHYYHKVGTFHKKFDSGLVSFGIQTKTYVSNQKDEVIEEEEETS